MQLAVQYVMHSPRSHISTVNIPTPFVTLYSAFHRLPEPPSFKTYRIILSATSRPNDCAVSCIVCRIATIAICHFYSTRPWLLRGLFPYPSSKRGQSSRADSNFNCLEIPIALIRRKLVRFQFLTRNLVGQSRFLPTVNDPNRSHRSCMV
jgi:hypothetical protein